MFRATGSNCGFVFPCEKFFQSDGSCIQIRQLFLKEIVPAVLSVSRTSHSSEHCADFPPSCAVNVQLNCALIPNIMISTTHREQSCSKVVTQKRLNFSSVTFSPIKHGLEQKNLNSAWQNILDKCTRLEN